MSPRVYSFSSLRKLASEVLFDFILIISLFLLFSLMICIALNNSQPSYKIRYNCFLSPFKAFIFFLYLILLHPILLLPVLDLLLYFLLAKMALIIFRIPALLKDTIVTLILIVMLLFQTDTRLKLRILKSTQKEKVEHHKSIFSSRVLATQTLAFSW